MRWGGALTLGLALASVACTETKSVAHVAIPGMGKRVTFPASVPARTTARARVHFDGLKYRGQNFLLLNIEARAGSSGVGTVRCRAYHARGDWGDIGRVSASHDCDFFLPADADNFAVTAESEHARPLEPKNLSVELLVITKK